MRRKKISFLVCTVLIFFLILLGRQAFISKKTTEISLKENSSSIYKVYCGNGKMGHKDGNRLEAEFLFNYGIALDKAGNLLVADSYNNRIRKISNDKVTTLAGYSDKKDRFNFPLGEFIDGDVDKAKFNKPRDLAVDKEGNLYISDSGNNVIRTIIKGQVYTFVGTGKEGYKDGKAQEAQFALPSGIAVDDKKNIYIADTLNHVIRRISPKGVVSTFAGVKSKDGGYKDGDLKEAMFNEPSDIVIDKDGAIYITDSGNQRIRKIHKGKVVTIAGSEKEIIKGTSYIKGGFANGQALQAKFNFPKGLCLDEQGNIYVADTFNHSIRVIKRDGAVSTLLGDGKSGMYNKERFNHPTAVLYKDGYLYVSDNKNNIIGKIKVK
ncbi:hypothetical protein [Clostridium ganghwense]|uniref:Teneurin NHL domain-containing protein n=1 Tax=Clostridium ganghwense TaxID=312089 RepID=A0ABT4CRP3_9CLOT|nr:hypothetical protein [Clostridium ganghwense]MCY6371732.1 hypothetical protein [Clostridium ganghwense]